MLLGAAGGALAALPAARAYWRMRESNAVTRGAEVAGRAGCFACHGPGGSEGITNPGAKGQKVPAWSPDVTPNHLTSTAEVVEFVRDGVAARLGADKKYMDALARAKIRMPAYRDTLSPAEIADVSAFVAAAAAMDGPPEGSPAARGRDEARERGCFGCHGPDGAGLVPNPGSLKGYVPGWRGPDFTELVESKAELRQWILDGELARFQESRAARFFLDRQRTKMPAYRSVINDDDVSSIETYIEWLRKQS